MLSPTGDLYQPHPGLREHQEEEAEAFQSWGGKECWKAVLWVCPEPALQWLHDQAAKVPHIDEGDAPQSHPSLRSYCEVRLLGEGNLL